MTGNALLRAAVQRLTEAGIPSAARDARLLLAHALDVPSGRLTLVLPDGVPEDIRQRFEALISRRAAREPVSHLVGRRAFWGRDFIVTPDVLDPRPETETLVACALREPFDRVLDLGTGSGCILLTLLAERPEATGAGTDLSAAALAVAAKNARVLGLDRRANFAEGSWFAPLPPSSRFDLIVSNPPYIAAAEMPSLEPELSHEPRMALTDESDGLTAYRAIAAGLRDHLAPGGRVMVEIGPTQGAAVARILAANGLSRVLITNDLDGRDRVVSGVFLPQNV